jgi:flavin reductase (DIM6/NTAB) family NADH-FMN oxidoreductase RutF
MDATQATEKTFTSLVGELDYPMFIVTTVAGDGERSGCLIGFATQISITPPRFLVGLSGKNHTYRVAQRAEHLAVHFVPADGEEIAELFGSETGDEVDKFARCRWEVGPGGTPVLSDVDTWFAGRVLGHVGFGDHVGFVLEPTVVELCSDHDTFASRRTPAIEPGHEP